MTRCIPAHWCDMWFNPSFRWCRCFWFAAIGVCLIESAAADESLVDFNREIRTILSNNCFKCHGPDKKERQSGLRLDQQQAAYGEAESGEIAIVPGKPEQSELIRRITLDDPEETMPPADSGKKLSER
ncbi:MAG: c-type cytochrome domain-containing protein, partial [Pirellulales bacterium]